MDTKKIMDKISDQVNVNAMKKELNDLKVLFNSLETKLCQFKQSLKLEKDLLIQTQNVLDEQISKTKEKADIAYRSEYSQLEDRQSQILNDLNIAINNCNKAEKRLFGNDKEIKRLQDNQNDMQTLYNQTIIDLEDLNRKSRQEMSRINSDIINGCINAKFYNLFDSNDIDTLNELLSSIKEIKEQIKQLEQSIEDSMIERDKTAQKIVALNNTISTILTERELYKSAIDSAANKAKDKTTQTVTGIVTGVEKGIKGASKIGKGIYTVAKRKADAYIQGLEEDGYIDQAEENNPNEKTAEDYLKMLENIGFFERDENPEASNSFNDEPKTTDEKVDGCIDNIANAIGLDPEMAENSKKLVKSFLKKFNNGDKE